MAMVAAQARGGGRSGASSHAGNAPKSTSAKSSGTLAGSEHAVAGYTRKDGTHVEAHHATNANEIRNDNYSTRGNINPHNGKAGTKPRDGE
jgi:hypothetical protein